MKTKRDIASGVLAMAVLLASCWLIVGCGGQSTGTSQAPTTVSQPPTSVPSSTTAGSESTSSSQTTTTAPSTTTSAAPTTTTLAVIIPGVASKVYENKKYGFSLVRPASTVVATEGFEGDLPLTQAPVVAFTLPEELFAGTNLVEAGVYVGASSSAGVVSKWDKPVTDSGESAAGTAKIDGVEFRVFTLSEGAAGNLYDERVYRTLHDGTCIEIAELLHSGEIGNYPPGIKEFNRAKFEGYLEAIAHSLVFIAGLGG